MHYLPERTNTPSEALHGDVSRMDDLTQAVRAMLNRMDDHDLLIRISAQMEGVGKDLLEVKTGQLARQQALESVVRELSTKVNVGLGICLAASAGFPLLQMLFSHK
jgi:hypothetical protein